MHYPQKRQDVNPLTGRRKLSLGPKGQTNAAPPQAARLGSTPNHRAPVQLRLRWLGGRGEPWVELTDVTGRCYRLPGTKPLWEVVLWLNGWA